jgi:dihydropteroate synthase
MFTLNLPGGRPVQFKRPAVMGIINATPDSFFEGSRTPGAAEIARRAEQLLREGADMLDVGAYSSRPGADDVTPDEECRRLEVALGEIRRVDSSVPVSVDTFRASVAEHSINLGADIINDISGGTLDADMFATVARLHVPYILMHMRGTPATMQQLTNYDADGGVTAGVLRFLAERANQLAQMGVNDVILDPGFGFSKTVEQNWQMMRELQAFESMGLPLLVGISRKSMLCKPLGITPSEALPATVAANVVALQQGADILRVHDVAAACQARTVVELCS